MYIFLHRIDLLPFRFHSHYVSSLRQGHWGHFLWNLHCYSLMIRHFCTHRVLPSQLMHTASMFPSHLSVLLISTTMSTFALLGMLGWASIDAQRCWMRIVVYSKRCSHVSFMFYCNTSHQRTVNSEQMIVSSELRDDSDDVFTHHVP